MKKLLVPLLFISGAAIAADNQTVTCEHAGDKRVIEVVHGDQGCEVRYTKGSDTKTLWNSPRAEYCTQQAAAFVDKQKGWGYQCDDKAGVAAAGEAPAAQ